MIAVRAAARTVPRQSARRGRPSHRGAALARTADVSRDTIYADLRARDIDPADREQPTTPRYRPLRRDTVRQAADTVAGAVTGAMLAEVPEPLVLAAWQAGIALRRVADLTDTGPNDHDNRHGWLRDLAARGDYVRQYANQALAEELPDKQVAAVIDDEATIAYDLGETTVTGATAQVYRPDERHITVRVGTRGGTGGLAGWSTWSASDGVTLPPVTAYRHLEITAALSTLAELLTKAQADSA
jgi:hypothetical protein